MSRYSYVLAAIVLMNFLSNQTLAQSGSRSSQYAVLISVSKYAKTDQWRPLPYTIDEMREFRAVLLTTGFAKENIEFLHDEQADEKLRPTSANLLKKIKLMLNEIGPDDTLLIALNGHGVQYKGDATGYFCPVNADLLDKKTLVAMDGKDGLYGLIESCRAKRKLLIVNACRNDPTRDLSFAAEKVQIVDRDESEVPKGIAALFSCKPGQKSYYYPDEQKIKRSMFYHHLIEAWRGKYADGAKVTLDHVFDTVTRKTAADARTLFSEPQTPWPRRKYEGEWFVSAPPQVHRGLAYAEPRNERQMLDVYAPAEGKNLPVVVWIHGGGWRKGDKASVLGKPKAFVDNGFVFVAINYRFVPDVTVKDIAGDVAKAIRWTHDHAKDYGGDPNSIIVAGHSAGAQLAALVCTDDRYLSAEKLPLSIVKACVPVDGDTHDVPLQIRTVEERRAKIYRSSFGDEISQVELSPVTHVAKGKNIPPFLILYVADHPETNAQTQRLVKSLQQAGVSVQAYPAEGKNHTTINSDLGQPDDRSTQEMFRFLDAVMKR